MNKVYKLLNVGIKIKMFKNGKKVSNQIRDRFIENDGALNVKRVKNEVQKNVNEKKYVKKGVLKFDVNFSYLPFGEDILITEKFEIVMKWQVLGTSRFFGINYMNAHSIAECLIIIEYDYYLEIKNNSFKKETQIIDF